MKKFRFTLQALLTLQKRKEQIALERFAKVIQRRERIKLELEKLDREWKEYHDRLRVNLTSGISVNEIRQGNEYQEVFEGRFAGLKDDLEKTKLKIMKHNKTLIEAQKQRKILDKYKDKKLRQYEFEQFKSEMKEFDEISLRFGFQKRGILLAEF